VLSNTDFSARLSDVFPDGALFSSKQEFCVRGTAIQMANLNCSNQAAFIAWRSTYGQPLTASRQATACALTFPRPTFPNSTVIPIAGGSRDARSQRGRRSSMIRSIRRVCWCRSSATRPCPNKLAPENLQVRYRS
jgi:hypothetical protein